MPTRGRTLLSFGRVLRKPPRRLLSFAAIGVLNTTVYALIYRLGLALSVPYAWASVLGYAAGIAISFALNRRFTFGRRGRGGVRREFPRFVMVNLAAMACNASIVVATVRIGGWRPEWAFVPAIAGSFAVGFAGSRIWVFREDDDEPRAIASEV